MNDKKDKTQLNITLESDIKEQFKKACIEANLSMPQVIRKIVELLQDGKYKIADLTVIAPSINSPRINPSNLVDSSKILGKCEERITERVSTEVLDLEKKFGSNLEGVSCLISKTTRKDTITSLQQQQDRLREDLLDAIASLGLRFENQLSDRDATIRLLQQRLSDLDSRAKAAHRQEKTELDSPDKVETAPCENEISQKTEEIPEKNLSTSPLEAEAKAEAEASLVQPDKLNIEQLSENNTTTPPIDRKTEDKKQQKKLLNKVEAYEIACDRGCRKSINSFGQFFVNAKKTGKDTILYGIGKSSDRGKYIDFGYKK